MLLGKRPRPPMKRTTSITEITFDLNGNGEAPPPSDPHHPFLNGPQPLSPGYAGVTPVQVMGGSGVVDGFDQRFLASVSPRFNRRHSGDFMDANNHFLRSCALCKRRLVPGRDIYMYRGDSAFCSLECRQQQMNQDDRKEKCSMASKKEGIASTNATRSKVSAKGETVAAV